MMYCMKQATSYGTAAPEANYGGGIYYLLY
jgi:hypothetical protein